MISSPGSNSARIAAISSAAVQEWVRRALGELVWLSSHFEHCFVNGPSPANCPFSWALAIFASSFPTRKGLLKGIVFI